MPFLICSKGGPFILRDADGVPRVLSNSWSLFQSLPPGASPDGDGDIGVREVVSADGFEPAPAYQKPVKAKKKPKEAMTEDASEVPVRRARVRAG